MLRRCSVFLLITTRFVKIHLCRLLNRRLPQEYGLVLAWERESESKEKGEDHQEILYTLSERKREDDTRHKETPTTRARSLYCTQHLFIYSPSKSVHVVYSNQLIATEALDKVWRKKNVCRLFSNPRLPDPRGVGFEERWVRPLGRKAVCSQPTIWQAIYRLAFPRAGLSDKHRDLNKL